MVSLLSLLIITHTCIPATANNPISPALPQRSPAPAGPNLLSPPTPGEVYWTMMDPVALPSHIVDQFKDGTIAITGYEMDQLDSDNNSIPYNRAYNHHYIGKTACMVVGLGS